MITTFREVQCLLLLYQACSDETIRRRALTLVPELGELADTVTFAYGPQRARRRKLTAQDANGPLPGHRFIVCRTEDVEEHARDFGMSFDLATEPVIVSTEDA